MDSRKLSHGLFAHQPELDTYMDVNVDIDSLQSSSEYQDIDALLKEQLRRTEDGEIPEKQSIHNESSVEMDHIRTTHVCVGSTMPGGQVESLDRQYSVPQLTLPSYTGFSEREEEKEEEQKEQLKTQFKGKNVFEEQSSLLTGDVPELQEQVEHLQSAPAPALYCHMLSVSKKKKQSIPKMSVQRPALLTEYKTSIDVLRTAVNNAITCLSLIHGFFSPHASIYDNNRVISANTECGRSMQYALSGLNDCYLTHVCEENTSVNAQLSTAYSLFLPSNTVAQECSEQQQVITQYLSLGARLLHVSPTHNMPFGVAAHAPPPPPLGIFEVEVLDEPTRWSPMWLELSQCPHSFVNRYYMDHVFAQNITLYNSISDTLPNVISVQARNITAEVVRTQYRVMTSRVATLRQFVMDQNVMYPLLPCEFLDTNVACSCYGCMPPIPDIEFGRLQGSWTKPKVDGQYWVSARFFGETRRTMAKALYERLGEWPVHSDRVFEEWITMTEEKDPLLEQQLDEAYFAASKDIDHVLPSRVLVSVTGPRLLHKQTVDDVFLQPQNFTNQETLYVYGQDTPICMYTEYLDNSHCDAEALDAINFTTQFSSKSLCGNPLISLLHASGDILPALPSNAHLFQVMYPGNQPDEDKHQFRQFHGWTGLVKNKLRLSLAVQQPPIPEEVDDTEEYDPVNTSAGTIEGYNFGLLTPHNFLDPTAYQRQAPQPIEVIPVSQWKLESKLVHLVNSQPICYTAADPGLGDQICEAALSCNNGLMNIKNPKESSVTMCPSSSNSQVCKQQLLADAGAPQLLQQRTNGDSRGWGYCCSYGCIDCAKQCTCTNTVKGSFHAWLQQNEHKSAMSMRQTPNIDFDKNIIWYLSSNSITHYASHYMREMLYSQPLPIFDDMSVSPFSSSELALSGQYVLDRDTEAKLLTSSTPKNAFHTLDTTYETPQEVTLDQPLHQPLTKDEKDEAVYWLSDLGTTSTRQCHAFFRFTQMYSQTDCACHVKLFSCSSAHMEKTQHSHNQCNMPLAEVQPIVNSPSYHQPRIHACGVCHGCGMCENCCLGNSQQFAKNSNISEALVHAAPDKHPQDSVCSCNCATQRSVVWMSTNSRNIPLRFQNTLDTRRFLLLARHILQSICGPLQWKSKVGAFRFAQPFLQESILEQVNILRSQTSRNKRESKIPIHSLTMHNMRTPHIHDSDETLDTWNTDQSSLNKHLPCLSAQTPFTGFTDQLPITELQREKCGVQSIALDASFLLDPRKYTPGLFTSPLENNVAGVNVNEELSLSPEFLQAEIPTKNAWGVNPKYNSSLTQLHGSIINAMHPAMISPQSNVPLVYLGAHTSAVDGQLQSQKVHYKPKFLIAYTGSNQPDTAQQQNEWTQFMKIRVDSMKYGQKQAYMDHSAYYAAQEGMFYDRTKVYYGPVPYYLCSPGNVMSQEVYDTEKRNQIFPNSIIPTVLHAGPVLGDITTQHKVPLYHSHMHTIVCAMAHLDYSVTPESSPSLVLPAIQHHAFRDFFVHCSGGVLIYYRDSKAVQPTDFLGLRNISIHVDTRALSAGVYIFTLQSPVKTITCKVKHPSALSEWVSYVLGMSSKLVHLPIDPHGSISCYHPRFQPSKRYLTHKECLHIPTATAMREIKQYTQQHEARLRASLARKQDYMRIYQQMHRLVRQTEQLHCFLQVYLSTGVLSKSLLDLFQANLPEDMYITMLQCTNLDNPIESKQLLEQYQCKLLPGLTQVRGYALQVHTTPISVLRGTSYLTTCLDRVMDLCNIMLPLSLAWYTESCRNTQDVKNQLATHAVESMWALGSVAEQAVNLHAYMKLDQPREKAYKLPSIDELVNILQNLQSVGKPNLHVLPVSAPACTAPFLNTQDTDLVNHILFPITMPYIVNTITALEHPCVTVHDGQVVAYDPVNGKSTKFKHSLHISLLLQHVENDSITQSSYGKKFASVDIPKTCTETPIISLHTAILPPCHHVIHDEVKRQASNGYPSLEQAISSMALSSMSPKQRIDAVVGKIETQDGSIKTKNQTIPNNNDYDTDNMHVHNGILLPNSLTSVKPVDIEQLSIVPLQILPASSHAVHPIQTVYFQTPRVLSNLLYFTSVEPTLLSTWMADRFLRTVSLSAVLQHSETMAKWLEFLQLEDTKAQICAKIAHSNPDHINQQASVHQFSCVSPCARQHDTAHMLYTHHTAHNNTLAKSFTAAQTFLLHHNEYTALPNIQTSSLPVHIAPMYLQTPLISQVRLPHHVTAAMLLENSPRTPNSMLTFACYLFTTYLSPTSQEALTFIPARIIARISRAISNSQLECTQIAWIGRRELLDAHLATLVDIAVTTQAANKDVFVEYSNLLNNQENCSNGDLTQFQNTKFESLAAQLEEQLESKQVEHAKQLACVLGHPAVMSFFTSEYRKQTFLQHLYEEKEEYHRCTCQLAAHPHKPHVHSQQFLPIADIVHIRVQKAFHAFLASPCSDDVFSIMDAQRSFPPISRQDIISLSMDKPSTQMKTLLQLNQFQKQQPPVDSYIPRAHVFVQSIFGGTMGSSVARDSHTYYNEVVCKNNEEYPLYEVSNMRKNKQALNLRKQSVPEEGTQLVENQVRTLAEDSYENIVNFYSEHVLLDKTKNVMQIANTAMTDVSTVDGMSLDSTNNLTDMLHKKRLESKTKKLGTKDPKSVVPESISSKAVFFPHLVVDSSVANTEITTFSEFQAKKEVSPSQLVVRDSKYGMLWSETVAAKTVLPVSTSTTEKTRRLSIYLPDSDSTLASLNILDQPIHTCLITECLMLQCINGVYTVHLSCTCADCVAAKLHFLQIKIDIVQSDAVVHRLSMIQYFLYLCSSNTSLRGQGEVEEWRYIAQKSDDCIQMYILDKNTHRELYDRAIKFLDTTLLGQVVPEPTHFTAADTMTMQNDMNTLEVKKNAQILIDNENVAVIGNVPYVQQALYVEEQKQDFMRLYIEQIPALLEQLHEHSSTTSTIVDNENVNKSVEFILQYVEDYIYDAYHNTKDSRVLIPQLPSIKPLIDAFIHSLRGNVAFPNSGIQEMCDDQDLVLADINIDNLDVGTLAQCEPMDIMQVRQLAVLAGIHRDKEALLQLVKYLPSLSCDSNPQILQEQCVADYNMVCRNLYKNQDSLPMKLQTHLPPAHKKCITAPFSNSVQPPVSLSSLCATQVLQEPVLRNPFSAYKLRELPFPQTTKYIQDLEQCKDTSLLNSANFSENLLVHDLRHQESLDSMNIAKQQHAGVLTVKDNAAMRFGYGFYSSITSMTYETMQATVYKTIENPFGVDNVVYGFVDEQQPDGTLGLGTLTLRSQACVSKQDYTDMQNMQLLVASSMDGDCTSQTPETSSAVFFEEQTFDTMHEQMELLQKEADAQIANQEDKSNSHAVIPMFTYDCEGDANDIVTSLAAGEQVHALPGVCMDHFATNTLQENITVYNPPKQQYSHSQRPLHSSFTLYKTLLEYTPAVTQHVFLELNMSLRGKLIHHQDILTSVLLHQTTWPYTLTIGRDKLSGVTIDDSRISRSHASLSIWTLQAWLDQHDTNNTPPLRSLPITATGHLVLIADIGSSLGTKVNGVQLQRALLNNGDIAEMGSTQVVFTMKMMQKQNIPIVQIE